MPVPDVLVLIGTKKGLFAGRRRNGNWDMSGPQFPMTAVYGLGVDTRGDTPRLLAGVQSEHYGPTVATSDDLAATWHEPDHAPIAFPKDTEAALTRAWQFMPGPASQPGVVYAGTEPSALFRSEDGGTTFELMRGLWDHPHRPEWGAGFGGQAIHSISPHPTHADEITVAMSTGGVYRSMDAGATWSAANKGIRARFMPDPFPEFGQCVHKIARNASSPDQMFAQNHHGVYRSDDGGLTWLSIADGLPSDFGFPMVAHPSRSGVIYNFPLVADGERFPPENKCRVYRSEDAGSTWTPLADGLPQENFCSIVLRDAMCADNADTAGVYFGTRSGEVFASADEGEHWEQIAAHLPDVLAVRAVVA